MMSSPRDGNAEGGEEKRPASEGDGERDEEEEESLEGRLYPAGQRKTRRWPTAEQRTPPRFWRSVAQSGACLRQTKDKPGVREDGRSRTILQGEIGDGKKTKEKGSGHLSTQNQQKKAQRDKPPNSTKFHRSDTTRRKGPNHKPLKAQ
ncbi:hypothetical protein NDU88_008584 [Pleurodeles waltl]|uniref:Uncharacterized protein n=1 Tax=Pleurodeles waltl TaxID=8319 RepID=A0AAV7RU77_PLEWA|nr:hypothetical protein NDU88_008584 [Pleurodeles waltl]